jgi:hypothetical protein
LPAWGSFEGWSDLVRSACVWVGLRDPEEASVRLREQADVAAESMAALLVAWQEMDPKQQGKTAAEVIKVLESEPPSPAPAWLPGLREAVVDLIGKLDARALGTMLRSYRRRIFAGRYIDDAGKKHGAARWVCFPASAFSNGVKDTPQTPHTPPAGHAGGESGESGESVSPQAKTDETWEEGEV